MQRHTILIEEGPSCIHSRQEMISEQQWAWGCVRDMSVWKCAIKTVGGQAGQNYLDEHDSRWWAIDNSAENGGKECQQTSRSGWAKSETVTDLDLDQKTNKMQTTAIKLVTEHDRWTPGWHMYLDFLFKIILADASGIAGCFWLVHRCFIIVPLIIPLFNSFLCWYKIICAPLQSYHLQGQ